MTFVEAIKKAYEKACALKREENDDYNVYYATLSREDFTKIDVEDSGKVCLGFKDLTVEDLTVDDWEVKADDWGGWMSEAKFNGGDK